MGILATMSMFLAGCGSPSGPGDASGTPTASNSLPPAEDESYHEATWRMPLASMLVIPIPAENRTVDVTLLSLSEPGATAPQACDTIEEETRERTNHLWVVVWNRTGVAHYEEHAVDWRQPFHLRLELPGDPPFMVWPGMTCFHNVRVGFHAEEWFVTDQRIRNPDAGDEPTMVVRTTEPTVSVSVPAGAMRGAGTLDVSGLPFFIELGVTHGTVERPSPVALGHVHVFAPGEPMGSDRWNTHAWWNASELDGTWELGYGAVADPGAWRIEVSVDAPPLNDTVWQVRFNSVWEFIPERLAAFGFQVPFRVWLDR